MEAQVSKDALADPRMVEFPALGLEQAPTKTLEQQVALRFRVQQQMALLQQVQLPSVVGAAAAAAWAARVEVSEETLVDSPMSGFPVLRLEQQVPLKCRMVH